MACGRADVDQFLSELSSRQVAEWLAFEQVAGPVGQAHDDILAGVVASTVANVNRDPKKRQKAYQPSDFVRWDVPEPDTPQQMWSKIAALTAALGGTVNVK